MSGEARGRVGCTVGGTGGQRLDGLASQAGFGWVAKTRAAGHAKASSATLPRPVKTIPDAVIYLGETLNPKKEEPLNSLEDIFAAIGMSQRQ
jgi:hypothetical protein